MMMKSMVAMIAALLCASSVDAFVFPVGRPCARQSGMRVVSASATPRHITSGLRMSSVATPPSPTSSATSEPNRSSNVQVIVSNDDFVNAMAQHQDKLVVIKFYDQFCRACDEIRPRYQDLSQAHSEDEAIFFELEFSTSKDLCKQLGIKRLPTVQVYSGPAGRVSDLPAGPSRFSQVEESLAEIVSKRKASAPANTE